jgi:hypothetical protein
MQTVQVKEQVKSETQQTNWNLLTEANDENFDSLVAVTDMGEEELTKAAKLLNASPELIREIGSYFESLRDAIHNDLADIWEKVNK